MYNTEKESVQNTYFL